MIQIVFAMQKQRAHEPIVSEVPRSLDYIPFSKRVTDVLARGPVESEAGIEHQCVLPAKIKYPEQRGKKCDNQQRFQAHGPIRHVLNSMEQIPSWFESSKNAIA